MRRPLGITLASLLVSCTLTLGQAPSKPEGLRLVLPQGKGDVTPPLEDWAPQQLTLLDNGTRLVAQFQSKSSDLVASYLIFPNGTGAPTSESCRKAVIPGILQSLQEHAKVVDQGQSSTTTAAGETLAVASYRISDAGTIPLNQENVFGFFGNAQTCFAIHLSLARFQPSQKSLLDATLHSFTFEPGYLPKPADYGIVGSLFFLYLHDFKAAAVYYQRTLDTLPPAALEGPNCSVIARGTVVQLAMAYGMSGDLTRSRAVSEAAIKRDPSFPMYYYVLADADADAGDATSARTHLEEAFAQRKNTLLNLPLPDPRTDDSFLKLKNDVAFWSFVESLPPPTAP